MDNYSNYSSLFAIFGGFMFILVILGIVLYVIMALGLQSMAKKLNIENPWLAWIPIANVYLIGRIAGDQITVFNKDIPKLGLVLVIGAIGVSVISAIPVIGFLACIAYLVIYVVTLYKIFRIFAESNAVLYCILSIVINVTAPFLILAASKNEPNLAIFNEGKATGYSGSAAPARPIITEPTTYERTPEPAVEPVVEPAVEAAPEASEAPASNNNEE